MSQPAYLTVREFAELTRMPHSSALTLIRLGHVSAIDVSTRPSGRSRYIIPRAAADDWLQSRIVSPVVATARPESGDGYATIQWFKGIDLNEAIRWVADQLNYRPTFEAKAP